jgi:acyl-CoA thioesterase
MDDLLQVFSKDAFAKMCGISVVTAGAGHAICEMTVTPDHLNGLQTVHGGAIFTLADFAFALACNSRGMPAVAINAHISYFKGVRAGTLRAEVKEISHHPRLGTYLIEVTDQQGARVALFQGTAYRKGPPSPREESR